MLCGLNPIDYLKEHDPLMRTLTDEIINRCLRRQRELMMAAVVEGIGRAFKQGG